MNGRWINRPAGDEIVDDILIEVDTPLGTLHVSVDRAEHTASNPLGEAIRHRQHELAIELEQRVLYGRT